MPDINYAAITGSDSENAAGLRCVLRDIIRRAPLILLGAIIVSLTFFVTAHELYTPKYTSRATLAVTVSGESTTVLSNLSTAEAFADVFSFIMDGSMLQKTVAAKTNQSTGDFTLDAQLITSTNMINLKATAATPELALLSAQAVLDNYRAFTDRFISNAIVITLSEPAMPYSPSNGDTSLTRSIQTFFICIAVFAIVTGAKTYLSDTLKTESEADADIKFDRLCTVLHERKYKSPIDLILKKNPAQMLISSPAAGYYYTESFKLLRSSLTVKLKKHSHRSIVVTSVAASEGKSTVCVNLAIAFAQKGARVLLCDCDLLNPSVASMLGSMFTGDNMLDDLAAAGKTVGVAGLPPMLPRHVKYPSLSLLMSGRSHTSSSERIINGFIKRFIRENAAEYDVIIIDTPPVSVSPDAETVASFADESLMVAAQNVSGAKAINLAAQALENNGAHTAGFVFNNVIGASAAGFSAHGYGHYGYGYGHYGHYGYDYGYGYGRSKSSGGGANNSDGGDTNNA